MSDDGPETEEHAIRRSDGSSQKRPSREERSSSLPSSGNSWGGAPNSEDEAEGDRLAQEQREQMAADQLPSLAPGMVLSNRYEIRRLLDRGGFGAVFEAADLGMGGRHVAIKAVFAKSGAYAQLQLIDEANYVANLDARFFCHVYDKNIEPGFAWIAMEKMAGRTLESKIAKEGPVPQSRAFAILRMILEGLKQAHRHNYSHRDLKPSNIMSTLPDDEHWKLIDLGLMRFMSVATGLALDIALSGTRGYLAPECFEVPAKFSEKSDIYAVGVVLHEMLSGFEYDEEGRRKAAPKDFDRVDMSRLSPEAQAVVRRATARDPNDRYADADAFLEALKSAEPLSPAPSLSLPPAPKRLLLGLTAAGVMATGIALVAAYCVSRPEMPPPSGEGSLFVKSRDDFFRPLGEPNLLPLHEGNPVYFLGNVLSRPRGAAYLVWIDSEGKVKPTDEWSWTAASRGKSHIFRWPKEESFRLNGSKAGLESLLWLVRDEPVTDAEKKECDAIFAKHSGHWRQPPKLLGKDFAVAWTDARREQLRGPNIENVVIADDPISSTEAIVTTLHERGLVRFSRAYCFTFVPEGFAKEGPP
jgi:serine/threonine protein kinase, bacterial